MSNSIHLSEYVKPHEIHQLDSQETVYSASQLMHKYKVGAVLVLKDGEIAGIMTERDLLNKIAAQGLDYKTVKLEEVMSTDLKTVSIDDDIESCFEMMTSVGCRHLPVIKEGEIVAIISIRNVLDIMLRELKSLYNRQMIDLKRTNRILKSMMYGKNE